ncbi:hypothetical protein Q9K02_10615 [Qipengyuania sp. G39]|uniref:Transposase n=1 Tax=Qipengyuania profundimaris TaxID=3067652 RepID=A0ABT9HR12_9SPHN|nr:hypothetical protein [Qipengyuania sp. G39]MDP4575589.1 hypothetical protein [Qipengyuania sp. G39]
MFDVGANAMTNFPHTDEPRNEDRAEEKLQYTIKGIERRSVDLMRSAAKQDGMKIGAWVSRRMREAAQASLDGRDSSYSKDITSASHDSSKELLDAIRALSQEIEAVKENQRLLISGLIAAKD